jgi:hypothetical protein
MNVNATAALIALKLKSNQSLEARCLCAVRAVRGSDLATVIAIARIFA